MNGRRWILAAMAAVASASAQIVVTNPAALMPEYSVLMDRLRRNELERLRAQLNIERLQSEMDRLAREQAETTDRRARLEEDVRRMEAQLAAAAASSWAPNERLMALVTSTLRPLTSGPSRSAEAMTIVQLVAPPGTGRWARVRWGDGEFLADPADFASQADILRSLEQRLKFVEEQIWMAPDHPDAPARERIERYEDQRDRLQETMERVRAAFQRAAAPSAEPTATSPPRR